MYCLGSCACVQINCIKETYAQLWNYIDDHIYFYGSQYLDKSNTQHLPVCYMLSMFK